MQVSSYVHSVAEKIQLYYVIFICNYAYEVVSAQTLTKLLLKLLGRFGRVCTRAGGANCGGANMQYVVSVCFSSNLTLSLLELIILGFQASRHLS